MGMNVDYTARKWTDDDLWQAIEHAHWAGVQEERRRVLAAYGQLRAGWESVAVRTWQEMRAERVALFTANAVAVNRRFGMPDDYAYTGGVVDWETGRPAASA
jgi:hypothetical protein